MMATAYAQPEQAVPDLVVSARAPVPDGGARRAGIGADRGVTFAPGTSATGGRSRGDDADTATSDEGGTDAGDAGTGERVLVVEDEPPVRTLIRRILTSAGYDVVEAENGRHALDIAAGIDEPIHALVTDVVMPELGGRELAERLVREHPDIAILFLSGYSETAMHTYGVFDMDAVFCAKPIRPAVLRRKLREAIDARSGR